MSRVHLSSLVTVAGAHTVPQAALGESMRHQLARLPEAAGVAQIVALTLFHASLRQVVVVQIVLMSGVLAVLLAWELWTHARETATLATAEVQTDSPF